jgi:hypothetical protein
MLRPIPINRKEKYTSLKRVMHIGGRRIKDGYTALLFQKTLEDPPKEELGSLEIVGVCWLLM